VPFSRQQLHAFVNAFVDASDELAIEGMSVELSTQPQVFGLKQSPLCSAMRARGTQVTDIAVLVVAADDGVMPQTREALRHARDAGCAIVVALTKCDRSGAQPERVQAELQAEGISVESEGGTVQVVRTAAPVGMGLRELEEAILLQAEMLEVSAVVEGFAEGTVVDAHLDKGQGPVATVVVRSGTLRIGDPVVVGVEHGRVRQMELPDGTKVEEATPGTFLLERSFRPWFFVCVLLGWCHCMMQSCRAHRTGRLCVVWCRLMPMFQGSLPLVAFAVSMSMHSLSVLLKHECTAALICHASAGTPVVLSGLRGTPHAGDQMRVVTSERRAKAVAEARRVRSQERYFERLAELTKDHFDEVVDEATGEVKQCAHPFMASQIQRDWPTHGQSARQETQPAVPMLTCSACPQYQYLVFTHIYIRGSKACTIYLR
jgi:hypothetical protein